MADGPQPTDPKKSYVPVYFPIPGKHNVHQVALRKSKASIYVRPDFDEKSNSFWYNKKNVDWEKILKLRDQVDDWFPGISFKKKNVK